MDPHANLTRSKLVLTMKVTFAMLCLLGCGGSDSDPNFSGSCVPTPAQDGVVCTIQNKGAAAGRACMTVRLQPDNTQALIGRRTCSAILAPEQTVTLKPSFEQSVTKRCVNDGMWICKIEVLETSRSMGENLPPEK